jgi:AcrR family transcriptional regulator
LEHGYLGLSMDRIAEEVEYSKGTVYQHFSSKEDLLAAMVLHTMDQRITLLEKAATYPGRPRERLVAIIEAEYVFYGLNPAQLRATQLVRISSILSKANPERRTALQASETRCVGIFNGIIRDGLANGDLTLPPEGRVEQVTFGLISIVLGFRFMLHSDVDLAHVGIPDPGATAWRSIHALLDGYRWQPLSGDLDYQQMRMTARQMVIAELPEGAEEKLSMASSWAAPALNLPLARSSGQTKSK